MRTAILIGENCLALSTGDRQHSMWTIEHYPNVGFRRELDGSPCASGRAARRPITPPLSFAAYARVA